MVPSLSTMRPELTGCLLRLCKYPLHLPLAPTNDSQSYAMSVLNAALYPPSLVGELRARWTELVYSRRSGAPLRTLRLDACALLPFILTVFIAHSIDHGRLFLCSSNIFGKSFGARAALLTSLIT